MLAESLPILGSDERQGHTLTLLPGAYVTHAKLADLGSGEILASEDGKVRIRFASGERAFLYERVVQHLTITSEAPQLPAAKPARSSKKKK